MKTVLKKGKHGRWFWRLMEGDKTLAFGSGSHSSEADARAVAERVRPVADTVERAVKRVTELKESLELERKELRHARLDLKRVRRNFRNAVVGFLAVLFSLICLLLFNVSQAHPLPGETSAAPVVVSHLGACGAAGFPVQHDGVIRRAWLRHAGARFADRHCRFRAQLARESGLRSDAASAAGAVGIGQQIASAALDCTRAGLSGSRGDVRFSAGCAALLMARHIRGQREPRTDDCRVRNAELAYVSGPGHVWSGQRVARERFGLVARCPHDGILEGMREILRPDAAREASGYSPRIDELERAMTE